MKLFSFHGGLTLQANKADALELPILKLPLPAHLYLQLNDDRHNVWRPVVITGDTVALGQTLAEPLIESGHSIIASSAGLVGDIDVNNYIELIPKPDQKHLSEIDSRIEFSQRLSTAGMTGLGGAGFSSTIKFNRAAEKTVDYLIINAAECEPMIACDQALMREAPTEIIAGIQQLHRHIGAKKCLIGIEDNKPAEIDLLTRALNTLGDPSIQLIKVPTLYPTGGERQLIKVLTGREVPFEKLTSDIGVVCFNVATAHAIHQLLEHNLPLTSRVITVGGTAIKQPRNVRAAFGTPISDLILTIAPELSPIDQRFDIILGGPMTGVQTTISANDRTHVVSAKTNCILVNTHKPKLVANPCIRCGYCDNVCPANLLPQQLHWYARDNNLKDAARFRLSACIECGCCDHVCPSHIPLTAQFRDAKNELALQQALQEKAEVAKTRFENRLSRLEKRELLKQQRLAVRKNAKDAIKATLERSKAAKNRGKPS